MMSLVYALSFGCKLFRLCGFGAAVVAIIAWCEFTKEFTKISMSTVSPKHSTRSFVFYYMSQIYR